MEDIERGVGEANRAFYAAFEARDMEAMSAVWERTERVSVTHPGWPTLRGWDAVAASWDAIFGNTPYIQFFLTDERIEVVGDLAWVTVTENILQAAAGVEPEDDSPKLADAQVAATNVFVRDDGGWRMTVHHGSPVVLRGDAEG